MNDARQELVEQLLDVLKDHRLAHSVAATRGYCAYCYSDLIQKNSQGYAKDHILPRGTYERYEDDERNWILSCHGCNEFKCTFDPVRADQGENAEDMLTRCHAELIQRSREHIRRKRAESEGQWRDRTRRIVRGADRIDPRIDRFIIDIPDATPGLIRAYRLDDRQTLLAIMRYNRLIDMFLGLTTYSLQNHLRTAVKGMGPIEVDELYIGIDKRGQHYVVPVQAKGGSDRIGTMQAAQYISFVRERFPDVPCRTIAAQFMDEEIIAMFELTERNDGIKVIEERHYRLVPTKESG